MNCEYDQERAIMSDLPAQKYDAFITRVIEANDAANTASIDTEDQCLQAESALRNIRMLHDTLFDFIEPFWRASKEAHEKNVKRKNDLLGEKHGLKRAERVLKQKIVRFRDDQEADRQRLARKLTEQAREDAETERDMRAEHARAEGDEELAKGIESLPVAFTPPVIREAVTSPDLQFRDRWSATLEDGGLTKLCKAISDSDLPLPEDLLVLNPTVANAMARALKEEVNRLDIGLVATNNRELVMKKTS